MKILKAGCFGGGVLSLCLLGCESEGEADFSPSTRTEATVTQGDDAWLERKEASFDSQRAIQFQSPQEPTVIQVETSWKQLVRSEKKPAPPGDYHMGGWPPVPMQADGRGPGVRPLRLLGTKLDN